MRVIRLSLQHLSIRNINSWGHMRKEENAILALTHPRLLLVLGLYEEGISQG